MLILNAAVLLVSVWPDQWWDRNVDVAVQSAPAPVAYQPESLAEQPLSSQAAQTPVRPPVDEPAEPLQLPAPAPDGQRRQQVLSGPVAADVPEIPTRLQQTERRPVEAVKIPTWPQIPGYLLEQLSGSLRLDVHVFASQPADRFVLINMKKYHQGQQLQEGPRLDEITADGVILSLRGEKFRLQAQ